MTRTWIGFGIAAILCVWGCSAEYPPTLMGRAGETPLFRDALWTDGRAEVARYRTEERRYGVLREGEATFIMVKETIDAVTRLKVAEPAPEDHEVIKFNWISTVPTGVYRYRQMASMFLSRADAQVARMTFSSQEWCGITHQDLLIQAGDARLLTSSYFEDEGRRAYQIRLNEETVMADSLPLWLRTLALDRPGTRQVKLVEALLSSHARRPVRQDAEITVRAAESLEVPAGVFDAVPVDVRRGQLHDVYWMRREAPHVMVRWDRSDGGHYSLAWVRRSAYWELTGNEDTNALSAPSSEPERSTPERNGIESPAEAAVETP